ncbi:MAG: hypothetical protein ACRDOM_05575 [Nocardioides sp.]
MTEWVDLALRLPSNSRRWASEGFRDELSAWVSEQVGAVTAIEPAKQRAWASVWRVETETGVFFAKQNCQLQSFEAVLLARLAEQAPEYVVPVTAIDAARGLLLTPDQGPVFGDTVGDDLETWCAVVAAGAELQRRLAPDVALLVDAGLATIAPADAVEYLESRVAALAALPSDDPRLLAADDGAQLIALLPTLRRWSEQVASLGLPITLNHNDLHEHNAFHVDGRLRFFDFADAVLAEPLAALLIPLNVLGHRLEAGPDDPRLARLADAALEVWSDLVPARELRAALPAALQLARLGRVEAWARCCASMDDTELAEWGESVPGWLGTLRLDPPVGRVEH